MKSQKEKAYSLKYCKIGLATCAYAKLYWNQPGVALLMSFMWAAT